MLLYKENLNLITTAQYKDPLLDHLYKKIEENLGNGKNKKLLDVGCGPGKLTIIATKKGFLSTGIDIEEKVLQIARKEAKRQGVGKNVLFLKKNLLSAKTGNNLYDVVVCTEVIEHLSNPAMMIKKITGLLKTNGLLVLTTPHGQNQWTVLDDYGEHIKRFEEIEIKNILKGYEIIYLKTIGFPFFRSLCFVYNLIIKKSRSSHGAKWREGGKLNELYYLLVSLLLKIDDLFNNLKMGTNFIVLARKI